MTHRIFTTPVSDVYKLYLAKIERKGRSEAELVSVICWLTRISPEVLRQALDTGVTFETFFAAADLNPAVSLITGSVCGVKVQEVEDPLMRQVRFLDKIVDELAKGKSLEKIERTV